MSLANRRPPTRSASSGIALTELTIAMVILVTSYLAFSQAAVQSMRSAQVDREATLALEAARLVMAELAATPFDQVYASYNENPADDPDGPGTAPGPTFEVTGLAALDGDPDGMVGEVTLPRAVVAGIEQLREDLQLEALGLPRDLNGDGAVDDQDHAADYQLLPVQVTVRWRGAGGPMVSEFRTQLVEL